MHRRKRGESVTTEVFEKSKKLLDRIQHIEVVLEYLLHTKDANHFIQMTECGFVSHPREELIKEEEVPFFIEAAEKEKRRLEQEFKML